MSPLTPQGRRAEEFNALLEGGGSPGRERDERLLEVVGALRAAPEVSPRPEYAADLRARLMAEAELVLSDVERKLTLPASKRSRRDRRVAIAAGAVALVGVSSSVAFASQGALPGDTLYPIKRALEGASTKLTFDDTEKGSRLLDQASSRLAEVEELARRAEGSDAEFRETLEQFTSQSDEAADLLLRSFSASQPQGVEKLRHFTGSSIEALSALRTQLPEGALDSLQGAVTLLSEIDELARELCPDCGGGITELPVNLTFLAAADAEDEEEPPVAKAPTLLPDYEYTDESRSGAMPTDDSPSSPAPQPGKQPDDKGVGKKPQNEGANDSDGKNRPKLSDTTKGLTDILVGPQGLLGDDGLVDSLLGSLLGEDGLVPGLLGGGSAKSDDDGE